MTKKLILFCIIALMQMTSYSQIEGIYGRAKNYEGFGFGAFLNLAVPDQEGLNYYSIEGGIQYIKFTDGIRDIGNVPVLIGYRYTLNQTGGGFYLEPHAGYNFGMSGIPVEDANGNWLWDDQNDDIVREKIKGPMAGLGLGYLFEPLGKVQFNLSLRVQHSFGHIPVNTIGLRLTHAFNLGGGGGY